MFFKQIEQTNYHHKMKKTFLFFKPGLGVLLCLGLLVSCKDYLELPKPSNSIGAQAAYESDPTVGALINSAFANISQSLTGPAGSAICLGLYTDEMGPLDDIIGVGSLPTTTDIFSWKITPDNISSKYWWPQLYNIIYISNGILENLPKTNKLLYKNQWLGEAYFMRALAYYYLVNIYGNVAVVTSTDYQESAKVPRTSFEQAYSLMQTDLKEAISLLNTDYKNANGKSTTDRSRPNQLAAKALLARLNLYTKQWQLAWDYADQIIKDTRYRLQPSASIGNTFTATSVELILGADCDDDARMYGDLTYYAPPGYLSNMLINAFEPGDLRKTNWIKNVTPLFLGTTISVPNKYKNTIVGSQKLDRLPLLRLAEQYLIRAEAAAHLAQLGDANKLTSAISDLNNIRSRAGLTPTTAATPDAVLDAIAKERRIEFFGEWGQRLFDLRRTNNLDDVMKNEMETSRLSTGAQWSRYKQYLPISLADQKAGLAQTPGY